jgi:hypothetical protein
MPRKKLTKRTKQTNLRAPEDLIKRLTREADKHRVSVNREILNRLHFSFEADITLSLEAAAYYSEIAQTRLLAMLHKQHRQWDLIRSVEALLSQLDQSPSDSEVTKAAADRVREVIVMIRADEQSRPSSMPIDEGNAK